MNVFDELDDAWGYPTIVTHTVDPILHYKYPKHCKDALEIWNQCKLKRVEPYNIIKGALTIWALQHQLIDNHISDDPIDWIASTINDDDTIEWISATGTRHIAKWKTFLRWMICACGEPAKIERPATPMNTRPSSPIFYD